MQQITHRLIVYDITDKRRLQRVHRCCGQYALSMQNSVFLFQGRPEQWQQFYQALHQLLTHTQMHCGCLNWTTAKPANNWVTPHYQRALSCKDRHA